MDSKMSPVDYFPPPTAQPVDDLRWPPAKDRDSSPPPSSPFDSEELQSARDSLSSHPPPPPGDFSRPKALPVEDLPWPSAKELDSRIGDWDWDSPEWCWEFPRPTRNSSSRFDSEETQPARGSPSSPPPPPSEDSEERHQPHNPLGLGLFLSLPLHQLQLRSNLLLPTVGDFIPFAKRMRVIEDLMHYSLDNPDEPIPRHALVSFVNAIAKRRQYLVVKEYLTKEPTIIEHDSSVDVILDTLRKAQILDCRFSKFNREAIWNAIHDRISEVRSRYRALMLHKYREYLQSFGFIKRDSSLLEDLKELAKQDPFLGLNSHDKKHELKIYKKALFLSAAYSPFLGPSACEVLKYYPPELPSENEKSRPPSDLVDNLVYRTLELGYVMDPNPEAELVKIKYSDPFAYNAHFILRSRTRQEYPKYELQRGTVRVENVSFDVSKETIRRFFSQCGDVVDVELTSGDKSQTAFVTFSNPEPIETALNLKDPVIENQPVRIISIHEYRVKFLKAFSYVESAVVKDDDDMLKLLTKYWYYSKPFCSKN